MAVAGSGNVRVRPIIGRTRAPLLPYGSAPGGSLSAMEPKKVWDGYRSFSYLDEGDVRRFELAREIGRVEPFVYPLGADDDARAERLLRELVCISLHEHGGIAPADWADNDAYIREGREWYGYEGLAASGLDAVFENFLDGTATITSRMGWKWTDVIHDLGMHFADVAHQSVVFVASTRRRHPARPRDRPHRDGALPRGRRADRERARPARRAVRARGAHDRRRLQRVEPAGRRHPRPR